MNTLLGNRDAMNKMMREKAIAKAGASKKMYTEHSFYRSCASKEMEVCNLSFYLSYQFKIYIVSIISDLINFLWKIKMKMKI